MTELWGKSAREQANGVRRREWTAVEVAKSVMGRIGEVNGAVNAYCHLNEHWREHAAQAQAISERHAAPLAGVPFSVKDLIPTSGIVTTLGSEANARWVPDIDELSVERMTRAGGIVTGKTNTRELGYGAVADNLLFGPSRNPWNVSMTTIGSSGGAAAAVATGMGALALGTDGGGSVRVPAAACGLIGLKPTFGAVPMFPTARRDLRPGLGSWTSLECIGLLTRSAEDLRLAFDQLTGPDRRDKVSPRQHLSQPGPLHGLRVAVSPDLGWCQPSRAVADIVEQATTSIADALSWKAEAAYPALPTLDAAREVFACTVAEDTDLEAIRALTASHQVSVDVEELATGSWSAARLAAARSGRQQLRSNVGQLFADFDLLLTPTIATPAFPLGHRHAPDGWHGLADGSAWSPFAFLFNLTGHPAISVPVGLTEDGLPVGLQIVTRPGRDRDLIALATAVEKIAPWPLAIRPMNPREPSRS